MKKIFSGFALLGLGIFTACGGDSGSSSDVVDNVEISSIAEVSSSDKADDALSSAKQSSSSTVDSTAVSSSNESDVASSDSNVLDTNSDSSSSDFSENKDSLDTEISAGWSWDVSKEKRLNKNIKYGTFTDGRDFKTYKYVTIGSGSDAQLWMAENLNYTDNGGICWSRKQEYCNVAGALYTWSMAIDSAALTQSTSIKCGSNIACDMPEKIQGVCPNGWHLPSKEEWEILYTAVGGKAIAGKVLKATSGWNNKGNGTDEFGFSALPAGSAINIPGLGLAFGEVGSRTDFWTSTPYNISPSQAYAARFVSEKDNGIMDYLEKIELFSVRCVTDAATFSTTPVPVQIKEWSWDDSKDDYINKSFNYGTLTDSRDGKKYRTIEIGEGTMKQTWMAENLNYYDEDKMPILKKHSWCFDNEEKNCELAGRLYGWSAAVDSAALANRDKPITCGNGIKKCGLPFPLKGICPDGWRIPSYSDWEKLFLIIENEGKQNGGLKLKSATGWYKQRNGLDVYGFSVLPVGHYQQGWFMDAGRGSHFWSAYEHSENAGETRFFQFDHEYAPRSSLSKTNGGASVRCIMNPVGEAAWDIWSWDVPKESRMNSKINYGSLKDPRDGKIYKTVTIGEGDSQTWMAENLNYYDEASMTEHNSWCPGNEPAHCDVGGRFYSWAVAIDSTNLTGDETIVQGICPDGWHLPSMEEAELLLQNANCMKSFETCRSLKSTTGWTEANYYGNGTDEYGFSVLPIGLSQRADDLNYEGKFSYFWTSTKHDRSNAKVLTFSNATIAGVLSRSNTYGASIRCIKNK